MIQATELRIGNWVNYIGGGAKGSKDYVQVDAFTALAEMQCFEPIPLTPEVLEGCGFRRYTEENSRNVFWVNVKGRQLEVASMFLDNSPKSVYITDGSMSMEVAEIQYLHQLQNLHFALTGIELTVSLPINH